MHVSFVFPCLNEEHTLQRCIVAVRRSFAQDPSLNYEIVVADNQSTDASVQIALANGARVVSVPCRGYGAALQQGIASSKGAYVVFGDADGTYFLEHSYHLYSIAQQTRADLVIASRFRGAVEKNAMPRLHRYIGTPALTFLINTLFRGRLSDCNSGFRCVRKASFAQWQVRSTGMEFASEMLIRSLKHSALVVEVPSGLRRNPPHRQPHLSTWEDGMRHLLLILSERPRLFEFLGILLLLPAFLLQTLALTLGPTQLGDFHIFDIHAHILLLILSFAGFSSYFFSCALYLYGRDYPSPITAFFLTMPPVHLLLWGFISALLCIFIVCLVFATWQDHHFANLSAVPLLIIALSFTCLPGLLFCGLLALHILRVHHAHYVPSAPPPADNSL